ncbi:serine carboxypeptidase-like 18 isoform X5 [Cucumis sativus]|uniref:serine carboxypeptidase-like 18 isoform X5 n=1 Tax=Cucumis sativus TaxID=3659 RepID=UPI0012F519AC|nr:serine carboxypeptidase-like 18 isoform X5 [Cucumis sativus]
MISPLTTNHLDPMVLSFRLSLSILLHLHPLFSASAYAHWTVNSLPGFSGDLPFSLETGYVGVGDREEFQLFYYFVKTYSNPKTDPLILWLTGGPRCSSLSGLAFESGPINFEGELKEGSLPQVLINPYSWTQNSSIIYLDLPVGTGFSYTKTSQDHKSGDHEQVQHSLQFLKKWFDDHPEFISNPFYIAGNSYSGMIVPIVALQILEGTYKHIFSFINFQGYILGNPFTIPHASENFRILFARNMALISDELYESLETSCQGEYVNIDPNNVECLKHYDTYTKCASVVKQGCILWPKCPSLKEPQTSNMMPYLPTIGLTMTKFEKHSIYMSGDHDMVVPHMETHAWIKALNYSVVDDWRPWFIDDEVGGYTRSFANNMTFVTVKGGGHTPEYLREESSIVFKRWIIGESL